MPAPLPAPPLPPPRWWRVKKPTVLQIDREPTIWCGCIAPRRLRRRRRRACTDNLERLLATAASTRATASKRLHTPPNSAPSLQLLPLVLPTPAVRGSTTWDAQVEGAMAGTAFVTPALCPATPAVSTSRTNPPPSPERSLDPQRLGSATFVTGELATVTRLARRSWAPWRSLPRRVRRLCTFASSTCSATAHRVGTVRVFEFEFEWHLHYLRPRK
jgi:hypothetical protein